MPEKVFIQNQLVAEENLLNYCTLIYCNSLYFHQEKFSGKTLWKINLAEIKSNETLLDKNNFMFIGD